MTDDVVQSAHAKCVDGEVVLFVLGMETATLDRAEAEFLVKSLTGALAKLRMIEARPPNAVEIPR